MQIRHTLRSPTEHAEALEAELSSMLFDLCIAAGPMPGETPSTLLQADEKGDGVIRFTADNIGEILKLKARQETRNAVTKAVEELNNTLLQLEKSGFKNLSKQRILEKVYVTGGPITEPKTILEHAIAYRHTELFSLLCKQGIDLFVAIPFSALSHNYSAFQKLSEGHIVYPTRSQYLLNALTIAPQNETAANDQLRIVSDITRFILGAEELDSFDKIPLQLAALTAVSPEMVNLLIPLTTKLTSPTFLFDLVSLVNADNKNKILQILTAILQKFDFNRSQLEDALLKSIRINCAEIAPSIIALLQSKGAVVKQKRLNQQIEDTVTAESKKSLIFESPEVVSELKALHAAKADFNPTFSIGNENLKHASLCNDPSVLHTVLSLCYFSQEQVDLCFQQVFSQNKVNIKKSLSCLTYGADIIRTEKLIGRNAINLFILANIRPDNYTALVNDDGSVTTATVVETAISAIHSACMTSIESLSKEECSQFLINLKSEQKSTNPLFFQVLEVLLKASANIYQPDNAGRTLLFHLVNAKNVKGVQLFCDAIRSRNLPSINHGKFYYCSQTHNIRESIGTFIDKIDWDETSDLFLLAKDNIAIVDCLISIGLPFTKETIKYFSQFHQTTAPKEYECYQNLKAHQTKLQTKPSKLNATSVDLDEKQEGAELKSVSKPFVNPDLLYSVSELKTLTPEQFIAARSKSLALSLNKLIKSDMNEQLHTQDHALGFTDTIAFILKLQSIRFDYITILTDKTYFPLRDLATYLARLHATRPELEAVAIEAAQVLLANAPYSQLKKLQENKNEFNALLNSLPSKFKLFLQQETQKPRATLGDLVFYLKQRSKNPDDKFYDRVPCLNEIISWETVDAKIENSANAKTRSDFYNKVRSKTTIALFAGETTRIIDAMQEHEKSLDAPAQPGYLTRLRFSSMATHRFITQTVEEINIVYDNKP